MLNKITLMKKKMNLNYNSGFCMYVLFYILHYIMKTLHMKTVNFVINLWTKLLHVCIHDNPGYNFLYFKQLYYQECVNYLQHCNKIKLFVFINIYQVIVRVTQSRARLKRLSSSSSSNCPTTKKYSKSQIIVLIIILRETRKAA